MDTPRLDAQVARQWLPFRSPPSGFSSRFDFKAIEIANLRQIIIHSVNNSLLEKRDSVFLSDTRATSKIVKLDRLKIFYNIISRFERYMYISSILQAFLYISVNIYHCSLSYVELNVMY